MASILLKAVKPTPTGLALLAVAALTPLRQHFASHTWLKLAAYTLLFINRGALPLRWHCKLASIFIKARTRFDLARWGWKKPSDRQRQLGLKKEEIALRQIGMSVFDVVTTRNTRVSFAEADYNLHLSNSNYAQAGDFARMQYASDFVGVPWAQDGIITLLGGTSFVYLREIPMFSKYSTESRSVAWDEKWCYFMTRFIVPYDPKSKRAPSKTFTTGQDCTVCAYLVSRLCFKRGKVSVKPEKVFALSGIVGPQDTASEPLRNWNMAKDLRKRRAVKAFVSENSTEEDGTLLRGAEERNKKALEIISRLTHEVDRKAWTELDELR